MKDYADRLQKILGDACPELGADPRTLRFGNVFGAVAGYVDGQIFCTCGRFGFALKLPADARNALFDAGAQPLRYFPNGHVKKDYAVLTDGMLGDAEKLGRLIETSIEFSTQTIP